MRRGFDLGFLAALGMALIHGIAWAVVELTFGLLVIGIVGGWVIGYAVRHPLTRNAASEVAAARPSAHGLSMIAAILAFTAWFLGSYVAFAIVQLTTGQGDLPARLAPANFAPFMRALFEPPLLQSAVLVAYIVVAAITARPRPPKRNAER